MNTGDEFNIGKVRCVWRGDEVNPDPGNYYVSCVDGGKFALLLGPFQWHADALAQVNAVRACAEQLDPMACFYGFGTVGLAVEDVRPGILNDRMNFIATEALYGRQSN